MLNWHVSATHILLYQPLLTLITFRMILLHRMYVSQFISLQRYLRFSTHNCVSSYILRNRVLPVVSCYFFWLWYFSADFYGTIPKQLKPRYKTMQLNEIGTFNLAFHSFVLAVGLKLVYITYTMSTQQKLINFRALD